jgi:hypothetical protein
MKETATQYLEIVEAKYVSDYKLLLTFNDGVVRIVDFGPFLAKARNPDTTDFRNFKKFKSFRIKDGDLVWGDYQMIFPIMDLYRVNILKGEEPAPSHYQFNEGKLLNKLYTFKYSKHFTQKIGSGLNISYKKPVKYGSLASKIYTSSKKVKTASGLLKRKKALQHV